MAQPLRFGQVRFALPQRFLRELALADVARKRQVEKLAALLERAAADLDGNIVPSLRRWRVSKVMISPAPARCASRAMDGSSRPTSNSRGCIPISSSRLQPRLSQACRLTSTTTSCSSSRKKASVARSTNVRKRASLARSSSSARLRSVLSMSVPNTPILPPCSIRRPCTSTGNTEPSLRSPRNS